MNLGRTSSLRPSVVATSATNSVAIFVARRNLEAKLAENRIPGRVEMGSRKDHLQVWCHSSSDVPKIQALCKKDKTAGFTFEGFQVLIIPA